MKTPTFLLLWLAALCLPAQNNRFAKLDSLFNLLEKHDKVMASLVISSDQGIEYQKAIGYANFEEQQANTPQTRFRIGSISKTFTALIIMQMVEEGKLKLDQHLIDFFPDLPNADSITIQHLLAHRSGLFNFTNDPKYLEYMEDPQSREQLLEIFKEYDSDFEPGEMMEYSNTNYVLLSFIAEEVDGQNFAAIFEKRIADKLGLENTFIDRNDEVRQTARSYEWSGRWKPATNTDPSIPIGAGAVVSTPLELNQAYRAVFNYKLCSKEQLETMQEERLGLFQFPLHELVAYGHNGGIDGFLSNAAYFPQKDVTVTFLSNGMNYNMNDVMLGVLSIYFDKPYTFPTFGANVEVDESTLKQYSGLYKSDNFPLDITLDVKDDQLQAKATGQPAILLDAKSESLFTYEAAGIELEFTDEGRFTLRQSGQVFEFVRE